MIARFVVVLLALAAFGASACGDDESAGTPTSATEIATPASTPDIVFTGDVRDLRAEDISIGSVVRYQVMAVVDFPLSKEDAEQAIDQIIADFTEDTPVNGLLVFLFDYEELYGHSFTLARAEFGPDGALAKAFEAETGDYSTHRTTYKFTPKMDDPSAAVTNRPTLEEAELCGAYDRTLTTTPNLTREQRLSDVAQQQGVDAQTLDEAVLKCVAWSHS